MDVNFDLERERVRLEQLRLMRPNAVIHDLADAALDDDLRAQTTPRESPLGDTLRRAMKKAWEL